MRLHRGYAISAAVLFIIEVIIALFVRDSFVRPVLGDVLAVMLVYCVMLSIFDLRQTVAALIGFFIAVVIEIMQYMDTLTVLGLEDNKLARVILGTTFTWGDIAAYAAGAGLSVALDAAFDTRDTLST